MDANSIEAAVGKSLLSRYIVEPSRNLINSYDSSYFRSFPGIVKTAALCIDAIAYISGLIVACERCRSVHTFTFVAGFAFWISLAFILVHCFQIDTKIRTIPWSVVVLIFNILTAAIHSILFRASILCPFVFAQFAHNCDLIFCGVWALLYLMASIAVMFNKAVIVGLFGIIAVGLYAYDAWLSFKKCKTERETTTSDTPNVAV